MKYIREWAIITSVIWTLTLGSSALAQNNCDAEAPYYFQTSPAGFSVLASLFIFAGSLPVATAAMPLGRGAMCMPLMTLAHVFVVNSKRD